MVEIDDPRTLSTAEHDALMQRCRKANMAIYVSKLGDISGTDIPRGFGSHFGLEHLDHNRGAEEDAVNRAYSAGRCPAFTLHSLY